ncbi:hypothetical protein [Mobilicoccus pelagius]|uniref:hypothetical protein n=1 Tax=Mobilicoccus pelagius TaxID=746032 RepID=UPI0002D30B9D|nr:hypothetical protein [Mobilicoccus pelagius]
MPELPASVRLALWATDALSRGRGDLDRVVRDATPDLADVDVDAAVASLDLWQRFGERVVLVSLPAPGDLVGLPRGGTEFAGAALDAGECAWSPLLGGALVPEFEEFGPSGDTGTLLRWAAYECTPPPLGEDDAAGAERALRTLVLEAVSALEGLDAPHWDAGLRDLADERVASGRWGLPPVDERARRLITQAAILEAVAGTALDHLHDAPTLAVGERRADILREVRREARRALVTGARAAALGLASGRS